MFRGRPPSFATLSLGSLLTLGGCGASLGQGLEPGWTYDQGAGAKPWLTKLVETKAPERPRGAYAIGVTREGFVGRKLPDGTLWTRAAEPNVLPSLYGNLVAYSEGDYVFALDAETGQDLWKVPSKGRLLEGLGDDGSTSALLLVDYHDSRADLLTVVDREGRIRFERSTTELIGTPAVHAGMVLVPWGRQYVTAFDSRSGDALGRLLLRGALGGLLVEGDHVFALGKHVTRLGPELASNPDGTPLPDLDLALPGEPRFPEDGTEPRRIGKRSVSVVGVPNSAGTGFAESTLVSIYYSVIMGLEEGSGQLRWVSWLPRPVIGSGVSEYGVLACAEDGTITAISLVDGRLAPAGSLDRRLSACVVSGLDAALVSDRKDRLEEQVKDVLENSHSDMESAKAFLLHAVRTSPRPEVTRLLLEVAAAPLRSNELRAEAVSSLDVRSDSPELFLEALRVAVRRARGEDVPAVALVPLARAARRLHIVEANPELSELLRAPLVTEEDALALTEALVELGTPAEMPSLLRFVENFRTTGGTSTLLSALELAVRFLGKNGDEATKARLDEMKDEASTHPTVGALLRKAATKAPAPKSDPPAKPEK